MKLKKHYDKLWEQSLQKFKRHEFKLDPLIDSASDTRYGITLLARPSREVKRTILQALEEIKAVAPNQYYYPGSDLHLTILSIISCYPGFSLNDIDQSEYQKHIYFAIDSVTPFNIRFHGLTASPSCILVQGFPEDNQLEILRDSLRRTFKQSDLEHSIDKRYQLQTAHVTAIRFKEPFAKAEEFVTTVADTRNRYFGSCTIDRLELVGNDWYQQKEKVKPIADFALSRHDQKIS